MHGPGELLAEVLRRNFLVFAYRAFRELTRKELKQNWHHQAIAHALANISDDRRLCVLLPPRNLKSFLVSIAWPAWMIGRHPSLKFLCASYGKELADDHARTFQRLVMSPFYRDLFPAMRIADRNAITDIQTTKGGGRRSTSVGGPATGFGGEYLIIDDPIKADDVNSEAAIRKALEWYKGSFATRGDDKQIGAQILVMQRLGEQDLAGYLISLGWPTLCLPAINDQDRSVAISTRRAHRWREGELLHPEHEPLSVLTELEKVLGPRRWSAQYLQNPLPERGNLILRVWLQTFGEDPWLLGGGQVFQSWDVAASLRDGADFSACVTARKVGNRVYVVDVFRGKLTLDQLREKVIMLARLWKSDVILIENTSNGIGLAQDLRGRPVADLPSIVSINPGVQSKYERVDAQTPMMAAGDLFLPESAPWLAMFTKELLSFPNGGTDDMVDALTQLLKWVKQLSPPPVLAGPEVIEVTSGEFYPGYAEPCAEWLAEQREYVGDPWGAQS